MLLDKQLGKLVKSIQFSLEIGVERAAIYDMSSQQLCVYINIILASAPNFSGRAQLVESIGRQQSRQRESMTSAGKNEERRNVGA